MNLKKVKKYWKPIALFALLFLVTGCSNSTSNSDPDSSTSSEVGNNSSTSSAEVNGEEESESKSNIRTVLQNVFNGPNEKLEKALIGMGNTEFGSEDYNNHFKKINEYFEERIEPYASERFYESFVINDSGALRYLRAAHPDFTLKTEGIMIENKNSYYKFSMEVSYNNNKSGESKTMEVRGQAQTNEAGKVTSINYINVDELYLVLS
ncbi:hypothetical protein CEH05_08210 [Halobacillus halophilus]|uniref:Lipoprotein n=1 Tax=Halobacillus halophilus (strain ATCC 35676 / DSM 2266 / JCM 20832 / KCTC 3685 / LMG 17431 / NBRC 102448 / NCIMB 2269) TaxID=866895 RepID=I0JLG7_HALH3|nr:hypothetical protein [Halobacillus halophilus]ASF39099.1 hypothetical protein CEH05_08210 [Halobacillus halophilus]CCG44987.1 hypothetical protein HBHAL_2636 [Halobacillus halophilus DSM 2266]